MGDRKSRDALREHLAAAGIETRNYFYPLHIEPVNFFEGDVVYEISLPRAEHLSQTGFYLPTHSFIQETDVAYITACIKRFFEPSLPALAEPRKKGWVDIERSKLLEAR